jgi:hypothetical protein
MSQKRMAVLGWTLAVMTICASRLPAQSTPTGPPAGGTGQGLSGPAPLRRFGQWPQGGIGLLGFEAALGNRVVMGEPYSAQVTVEHRETLADGTIIDRKNTFMVYRDGQGRTRREMTLPAIGSYVAAGEPPKAIFINDPVAGVRYVLDPQRKTARRFNLRQGAPANSIRTLQRNRSNPNVTSTSLGSKTMEGLYVQGTQITRRIPAEKIGNNKPIEVVTTRWYAPDLSTNLQITIHDPLRGNTLLSLTNISRDEPDASLFEVPTGYSVQTGGFQNRRRGSVRGGPGQP